MKTRKALATSGKEANKTYRTFECSYFGNKQDFLDYANGLPDDFDCTPKQTITVERGGVKLDIDLQDKLDSDVILAKKEQVFGDDVVAKALNNGLYLLGHSAGYVAKGSITEAETQLATEWAIANDKTTFFKTLMLPKKAQEAYLKLCLAKAQTEPQE